MTTDFHLLNDGSVVLLTPVSHAARLWVRAHLPQGYVAYGGAIAIEPRFAGRIIDGIAAAKLTIGSDE